MASKKLVSFSNSRIDVLKLNLDPLYIEDCWAGNLHQKKTPPKENIPIVNTFLTHCALQDELFTRFYLVQIEGEEFVIAYWLYDKNNKLQVPFYFEDFSGNKATQYKNKLLKVFPKIEHLSCESLRIDNKLHLTTFAKDEQKGKISIKIDITSEVYSYYRGDYCHSLPFPGE